MRKQIFVLGFLFIAIVAMVCPQPSLALGRKIIPISKQIVMKADRWYVYFHPDLLEQGHVIPIWEGPKIVAWIRATKVSAAEVEVTASENGTMWGWKVRFPIGTTDRDGRVYVAFPDSDTARPRSFVMDFTKRYTQENWRMPLDGATLSWGEHQEVVAFGDTRRITDRISIEVVTANPTDGATGFTVRVDGIAQGPILRPGDVQAFWGSQGEYLGCFFLVGVGFNYRDPIAVVLNVLS